MAITLQRTAGKVEARLAQSTGLRRHSYVALLATNTAGIVAAFAPTKTTATEATIANGRVNYPSTICITINQTAGVTTGTVQATIRGLDQFGNYAQEVTPTVSCTAVQFNHIYCAQVFSVVTSITYLVTGLGTTSMSVGQRFDWVRTDDASNKHHAGLNLGIGVPMQLQYVPQGVPTANRKPRDLGIVPEPTRASGTLTLSANPADGETVTIDGVVYTFKNTLAAAYDVKRGADATESAANLQKALDLSGTAGTNYHASTGRHATVGGLSSAAGVLTVKSRRFGAEGNLIATTETLGSGAWANATLTNGRGSCGEIESVMLQVFKSGGNMTQALFGDIALGYTVTGWSGSIEKLSILTSTSVGNMTVSDKGIMTIQIRSQATGW